MVCGALLLVGTATAQTPSYSIGGLHFSNDAMTTADLFTLSQQQFNFGTARSMGMAGAFTSLGADMASMVVNPAGLGMYRRGEVALTPMVTIANASTPGTNSFESNSKSRFEYNLDNVLSKYDLNLSQDKVKALGELEKIISGVYSSAERDIYIRIVAQKFEVDQASIKADVDKMIAKASAARRKDFASKVKQDAIGYSDRINPDFIKAPAAAKNEESVLGLLLLYPEHRKRVFEENLLDSDDFITELNKRVFEYLKRSYTSSDDTHTDINECFTEDEVGRITRMKISRMQLTDNGSDVLLAVISSLRNSVRKKTAEKTNTYEGLNALLLQKRNN